MIADDGASLIANRYLGLARAALGLDMTWLSEHRDGRQVVRSIEGDGDRFSVAPGDESPLAGSYCIRVLDGRLPALVRDARADAVASALPITDRMGIGAYAGAPVRLPGGRVYGMLCGFGQRARHDLSEADLRVLTAIADAMAVDLFAYTTSRAADSEILTRVERAIAGVGLRIVVQPIVDLQSTRVLGYEALSRFDEAPSRPDAWFAQAAQVGRGVELELAAARQAISLITELPGETYLSVNCSPATLCSPELDDVLSAAPARRLVLELTEHASVGAYQVLQGHLEAVRARGVRLAVDDAGAGYASFRHILMLRPDIVKLDRTLVTGIETDPAREALAGAFVTLCERIGASTVAEGVEAEAERVMLARLGVLAGQGYLFGRPRPVGLD